nr:SulP family inorganic anion transporter [uncultured Blautia sp.]
MNSLKPMLLTCLKSYDKNQFVKDVTAGIIVAIIALPLSIALALASGVGPEAGIFTAIVAGFVISALGGSNVQIAGPTAAFATIVAGIVARDGMDGLVIATVMAGIFLILMGLCHFGSLIKFIPYTITTGFTSGIAVTIVIGQLKDFFGVTYPDGVKPIETTEKLEAFVHNISSINTDAVIVGAVSLAILIIAPYIFKKIPGSLIAVIAGILMVQFLPLKVSTIGNLYTISNSLPQFHLPAVKISTLSSALPNAFTIAVLAAIESLLSCVVADGMINTKHRSDMELVAQGAGNIASALFGGIPATGAIARTAANIKNGGRTPIAGMVHSVTLVIVLVILMPYAGMIPMPTIAAILFIVAYNMCQWRTFRDLLKTAPKSDIIVLIATFVLTVVFDLVVAIEVGMVLACLLFIKRMSEETHVDSWVYADDDTPDIDDHLRRLPLQIRVYEITGPLFFGAADAIEHIVVKDFTRCLVIRMRSVPALDSTALNALKNLVTVCERKGITLVFSHVNEQPMRVMKKAGFPELVGEQNFCPNISAALTRAEEVI